MPVTILDRIYTPIERPFDQNIKLLLGNTGVWQKLRLTCDFEVAINFSTSNALFMEEPNIFTLAGAISWKEYGFDIGDLFLVKWALTDTTSFLTTVSTVTGLIISLNDKIMISSNTTLGNGALATNVYPAQFGNFKIHSVFIAADKQPKGINVQYGHLKNSEASSLNLKSYVDGTDTVFFAKNVDTMAFNAVQSMSPLGLQSGMSIASCKLTYVTKISYQARTGHYIYYIDIVFMINSFFDDVNNLKSLISPDITLGSECVTDNFDILGRYTYNDPNVKISNDMNVSKQLGNTGWFNENYNGLADPFTITSFNYTNQLAVQVPQLDYQNTITLRCVIEGISNLNAQTKCTFGFIWIPIEESDYKDLPEAYHKNTKISTGGNAALMADVFNVSNVIDPTLRIGYSNDGAYMGTQNIKFQQTAANQITFTCDFVPNAAFATFMDARDITERNYALWVNIADQTLEANQSDRVCKLIDTNQMDTYITPIGEYDGMTIGFLTHTQDNTDTPSLCGDDIKIEDDISAKIQFQVDTAISPTIPIPTGLQYGILIERNSDGFQYILDKYSIDLTQYPTPQQYGFVASRGFKYGTGNPKNIVSAEYFPALDAGTLVGVQGLYGYKIRWEDWIARFNVPTDVRTDFYDSTLKSSGLSNDWYRYLLVSGWSMYFYVFTNATLNGSVVRYVNKKQLLFDDYDQNANVTTVITYKRASDLTVLSGGTDTESGLPLGIILSSENVRVEIEYTRLSGTWASLANVYSVTTIEVREGAGQPEFRQLSSEWLPENDNPLEPLTGATLLDVVLVSPTLIRTTCLVNPFKLLPSQRYKITGRLGCK